MSRSCARPGGGAEPSRASRVAGFHCCFGGIPEDRSDEIGNNRLSRLQRGFLFLCLRSFSGGFRISEPQNSGCFWPEEWWGCEQNRTTGRSTHSFAKFATYLGWTLIGCGEGTKTQPGKN